MSDTALALLALGVSVALVIWELARYLLEGARVRVRMNCALLDDYSIRRSTKSWETLARMVERDGGWFIEAAEIEIENVSRSALTITDVSLDFGRTSRFGLRRRTVGPRPLAAPDATQERATRLEPFDRCSYVFDVWHAMRAVEPGSRDPVSLPVRVRASVRVAGRSRRRRSPWRRGWLVRGDQLSFLGEPTDPGMVAWQALFRHLPREDEGYVHHATVPTALAVRERFPLGGEPPTTDEVSALLREHTILGGEEQRIRTSMAAWNVAHDLKRLYVHASDEVVAVDGE